MSGKGGEEGEPILTGTPADTVGYDPIYTETYKKKETVKQIVASYIRFSCV